MTRAGAGRVGRSYTRGVSVLAELASSRELVANLTQRELKGKYKRSALGWAWSLLNPIATMAIFTVVFRFVLRVPVPVGASTGIEVFALWLLCGLLVWNLISSGMSGGIAALIGNANLIKKVYFPREALVVAAVLALVVSLLIELGVLAVALAFFGNVVVLWLPVVALLVALLTVFTLGLALMLSVANVYFRDLQYFVTIFLQLWFYATPVIYPISLVQDRAGTEVLGVSVLTLYDLNPAVAFVEAFRDVLYDLQWPSAQRWGELVVWSVVSLAVGVLVFRRFEGRLAEEL